MTLGDIFKSGLFVSLMESSGQVFFYILGLVLCAIAGYFLGCLNFGIILSKKLYHDDVRSYGSGNAGATNMMRTYGKKASILTFLGDGLKAVAAVYIGFLLDGTPGGFIAALFCVIGHAFPCFYGFKGGKGVAATAFAVLVLSWPTFLVLIVLFIAIVAFTRYISLGSIMCMAMYPFLLDRMYRLTMGGEVIDPVSLMSAILTAALVIFLHRENINRLWHGNENKFSFKKSKKADSSASGEADDQGKEADKQ